MPNPKISSFVSAYSITESDNNNGEIPIFTISLKNGFSLSRSATYGENE